MHEVRVTAPVERSAAIAQIAIGVQIRSISVYEVFVPGPECRKHLVSVETSTPKAKAFIDALLASSDFDIEEYSITSRELRAIISHEPLAEITRPTAEPAPDVIEYLWQMSHITPSYIGRALGGAILMADGVIHNSPISIVVAALFLPFLSQVLAVGFGIWCGDWRLARKGAAAILISAVLAYGAGLVVGMLSGGQIAFQDFKDPLQSFAICAVIGTAAGLSTADDAGRRYLVGVAAAVQFAIFPAWLGAASILGLPSRSILTERVATFVLNVLTIGGAAVIAYVLLGLRRAEFQRFIRPRHGERQTRPEATHKANPLLP
jgi:hypothetical protein